MRSVRFEAWLGLEGHFIANPILFSRYSVVLNTA